VDPEVDAGRRHVAGGAVGDDLAGPQDRYPVGVAGDGAEFVRDEQHRRALVPGPDQGLTEASTGPGVDAGRRFGPGNRIGGFESSGPSPAERYGQPSADRSAAKFFRMTPA